MQGAFASRDFHAGRALGTAAGAAGAGKRRRLPLRRRILTYNSKAEFPALLEDRWSFYLEENGQTPIRSLAHRVGSAHGSGSAADPAEIPTEILLIQGNEDRIVARRYFDLLKAALPRAEGVILPTVGHQPHLTHAEVLAGLIGDWLLPCAPGGCSVASKGRGCWIASRRRA